MSASASSAPASARVSFDVASALSTRQSNSSAVSSALASSRSMTTTSFPDRVAMFISGVPMSPAPTMMMYIGISQAAFARSRSRSL
jgi:hypothetical protein